MSFFELGNAFLRSGEFESASRAYQSAAKYSPQSPQIQSALGIAYTYLERLDDAVDVYRTAISLGAGDAETHFNLGSIYLRLERSDKALLAFRTALEIDPDHQRSYRNIGHELVRVAQFQKSIAPLEKAVALDFDDLESANDLASALAVTGDIANSIDVCEQALGRHPANQSILVQYASSLIFMKRYEEAAEICNRVLEIHPGDTAALAFAATALNEAGERAAAARILNFDLLLKATAVTPGPDFSSIGAFNDALETAILEHPTLSVDKSNRSLSNGRCTGDLCDSAATPSLLALKQQILIAVAQYKTERPVDPAHPFLFGYPGNTEIFCWANVMDALGFHDVHFHPRSWLSGVYYPRIPEPEPDMGETSIAGWIEFGRAFHRFQSQDDPPVRLVRPLEGLMVLFPSYFGHRTIPLDSRKQRISIAFDIVPVG